MEKKVLQFSEFENFYQHYKPLTPYGSAEKNRCKFYYDAGQLNEEYQFTEDFINFIDQKSYAVDKIEYHLKKIPLLNSLNNKIFDSSDLFLIKKFMINYREIIKNLAPELKDKLNISFQLEQLLKLLSPDGDKSETFYLSSKYDENLAEIRKEVKAADDKLRTIKKERIAFIKENYSLDFRFKDFLVIAEERAMVLDKKYFFMESFDNKNMIIKPVYPKNYFNQHKTKDDLIAAESEIEKKVLTHLSAKIIAVKETIEQYLINIKKVDTYLAKAKISKKFKMNKPLLKTFGKRIKIIEGRYLPLVEKCQKMEMEYSPLSAQFNNKNIIITGSNMGGKTMLLKTMAFMQILTQLGFFVPADDFETVIFEHIFYIGEAGNDNTAGLSSFGFEIHNFMKAMEKISDKSLYLIDEFARTTNSIEAKALVSAVLKIFSKEETLYSYLSTHLMDLPQFDEISFYRMKGLNYTEYKKYYDRKLNYSLHDRIKLINSFMCYEVVETDKDDKSCDALKIADTLGLNPDIIECARQYLGGNDV